MANNSKDQIAYFGETDSRGQRVKFGIKASDRTRHVYVIGKTGMGKSTVLENMAIQDINNGNGLAFIDPHGKTAELLLEYVPEHRIKDVLYFAPFDMDYPISFNVMEDVGPDRRHLVVSGLMSAFKKLFGEESFSDRMQYILQNTILALLEYPGSTMLGINRMLTEKAYRDKVVANITDTSVKAYWTQEFANYTERFAAEATPAIQNKIGQFTANPLVRNIIGQPKSSFDIRKMMDEGKIMIINLSKGMLGEANANLLGSMLITKIYLAAMSRADAAPVVLNKLPNFYLYVDEFQSFANESFADILSEARKYKLNLTIAHQYIEQMPEEVRAAVFGNVGTMITFRVGAYDAEVLEKEFKPYFLMQDLVNLDKYQMYLKLMIDGVGSQPFSAVGMPPIEKPIVTFTKEIMKSSREHFGQPRMTVEEEIKLWHQPIQVIKAPKQQKIAAPEQPGQNHQSTNQQPNSQQATGQIPEKAQAQNHQHSPSSQSGHSQTQHSQPRPERKFPREEDIRKAISLGDLVPVQNNGQKREEKGPKKDNVNALRDALSVVLKDAKATQQSNSQPTTGQNTTQNKISASEKPQPQNQQQRPEQKKETTLNQEKSRQETQSSRPVEVPEDVLKRILDVSQ